MASLRPKTQIDVKSDINLSAQQGGAITAVIGTAQWGDLNVVKTVNNLSEAIAIFGDDRSDETLTLIKALDMYYNMSFLFQNHPKSSNLLHELYFLKPSSMLCNRFHEDDFWYPKSM